MKQLQIIVSIENIEFGKANFIHLKKESHTSYYLVLEEFTLTNEIKLTTNNIFNFNILYKNQLYSEFELVLSKDINYINNQEIVFYTNTTPREYSYNQNVIDLFRLWDLGKEVHWHSLKVKGKKAWLKACLYSSGLPKCIGEGQNFVLDGSLVKHEVDFYCLLGEVFFGARGYFGQDLHGLEDCINEFYTKGLHDSSITFRNINKLENVLNKITNNYIELVIEIFDRGRFVVIKE